MLDTTLEAAAVTDEAPPAITDAEERPEAELADEETAEEVIVEISVDGMCGVY